MNFTLKTKIFNKSLFVFLFLTVFSFGFLALADEQEMITTFLDDADQDGLSIEEEKAYGTDPSNKDTDGDSYSDGVEIESGYDPLKPAPGDRIVPEVITAEEGTATSGTAEGNTEVVNLTEIATEELANIVNEKQDVNQEFTNEDFSQAVSNVLQQANQEVELPEVDVDKIKIKELEAKLSESEKEKQRYQDTVEYLTTIGYILASNSPVTIRSQSDVGVVVMQSIQNMTIGLASGNYKSLDDLAQKTKKIVEEIGDVKVPETMLSTHVKALKILGMLTNFVNKIKGIDPTVDPLGQMSELAKMQGGLIQLQGFYGEITQQLTTLGLSTMSLEFLNPSMLAPTP